MQTNWWVLLTFACGWVATKDGMVVDTMPVLSKFRGRPMSDLWQWSPFIEARPI